MEWQNIPEATHPEFFVHAAYVGKSIRVRVTPISKDGIKGVTETVRVRPSLSRHVLHGLKG
eukprot:2727068-Pyramimonas_sp.AAC.2